MKRDVFLPGIAGMASGFLLAFGVTLDPLVATFISGVTCFAATSIAKGVSGRRKTFQFQIPNVSIPKRTTATQRQGNMQMGQTEREHRSMNTNSPVPNWAYTEAQIITAIMNQHGVTARVRAETAHSDPYCYTVFPIERGRMGGKQNKMQSMDGVEAVGDEIGEALSQHRGCPVNAVFTRQPFTLIVPNPIPNRLDWEQNVVNQLPSNAMLVGRGLRGGQAKYGAIMLDDKPHVLAAGMTGAGKSKLLQNMLCSLTMQTSPNDLRLIMVDLKNEDLVPFANLPHTEMIAYDEGQAEQAIAMLRAEQEARRDDPDRRHPRIVFVCDEIAQLAKRSDLLDEIGKVIAVGRSYKINIIAATQRPTAKGGIERMMTANFETRVVGLVADATEAHTATGRRLTRAELLPGNGSFLQVSGNDIDRVQVNYIDDIDALVAEIARKWGGQVQHRIYTPAQQPVSTWTPAEPPAPPPDPVVEAIRPHYPDASIAAMIRAAFGDNANTGGSNRRKVLAAIDALEAESESV